MGIKENIISNTVYLFADQIAVTFLSFLFWVVIGKTLPPDYYGIIATSTTIITLVSVLALLGVNTAIGKLIPEYTEENKRGKIANLVKFSLKFSLVANLVLALIFIFLSPQLSDIFKMPLQIFYLTILGIFLSSISTIVGSVIYGLQEMKKYFISDFAGNTVKLILSILLILFGFSLYGPMIGFLAFLFSVIILRFEKKWLVIKSEQIDIKNILVKYSFPALVFGLASLVFSSFQFIILPILTTQQETGLFAIADKITYFISVIPMTITISLFPIVSGLSVYKKTHAIQSRIINLGLRYILFLTLPFLTFIIIFANAIILIFSSSNYLGAYPLFFPLALSSVLYGVAFLFINGLYAIRKPEVMRNISIVVTIVFLILSVPLTMLFSSLGMSYALLLSMLIMFVMSFYNLKKFLRIHFDVKETMKTIFANVVLLVIFLGIDVLQFDFFVKLLLAIFAVIIYLLILLFMRFFTKDDITILSYLESKMPQLRKVIAIAKNIILKYI